MWNPKLKLRCYKLLLTVWNMMYRLNCLSGTLNKAAIRKWAIAVGPILLEDSDRVTPGPLWDEMVGGNDTEQCASELLDPSSSRFACLSNCVWRQGAGAGNTYALWGFYITPGTAEGVGSHISPLLTHHRPPCTNSPLCKRKLIDYFLNPRGEPQNFSFSSYWSCS